MGSKKPARKALNRQFLETHFSGLLKSVVYGVTGSDVPDSRKVKVGDPDISFGSDIVNQYSTVETLLRRNVFIDEAHSGWDIKSACSKALCDVARHAGTKPTSQIVKAALDELCVALLGSPIAYEIMLPLSGVLVTEKIVFPHGEFNPSSITALHEHPKIQALIAGRAKRVGSETQAKDTAHFLKLGERGESKSIASVTVNATNSWAAIEKAKRTLAFTAGLISLALFRMDRRRYLIPLDFANGGYADWSAVAVIDSKAEFSYMHFQSGSPVALVDVAVREKVNEYGMNALFRAEDQLSEIGLGLRTASYWVWRSLMAPFRQDAVLHAIMAIECLLKRPGLKSNSTILLAERIARLLGKSASEQLSIDREVRHLYDIRSQIVHEGYTTSTIIDIESARNLGVATFFATLDLISKFGFESWQDLENHFDTIRYQGPTNRAST